MPGLNVSENFPDFSTQSYHELTRLIEALDRLRLREAGVNPETVQQRFDIFCGRIESLQEGETARAYAQVKGADSVFAETAALLARIEPQVVSVTADDAETIEALKSALRELAPRIHIVGLRLMLRHAEARTAVQTARKSLQRWFFVWLLGSLLVSGLMLVRLWTERQRLDSFSRLLLDTVHRQTGELLRADSRFRATVELHQHSFRCARGMVSSFWSTRRGGASTVLRSTK